MWKKWRLFYATDFQKLMYPCIIFCRIFGIFPYKINDSTFKISKPYYILSSIIIYIFGAFYLLSIYNVIISKTITYGYVEKLQIIFYFTCHGFTAIIIYVMSHSRMRLLQTILRISSKLSTESYKKLSMLFYIKDILGNILLIVQTCMYCLKMEIKLDTFNIIFTIFSIYLAFVAFEACMLYINCVCILKAYFKDINNKLTHIQKFMINDVKPRVPRLIYHMERNDFFLLEIKVLQKQHLMISRTVEMLNKLFSLQLIATVIGSFTEITFELYFNAVHWQDVLVINFDWRIFDIFLTTMIHCVIKITLLVWACETGKNQAREISTTIHDVLNNTRDKQIRNELQLFSFQTLHCKNIFSAKALTVDATLLTAIVSSITTYILILVQFLITEHSCDNKK